MRIPRIFYRGELRLHELIVLDERASHHLLNVLRLKPGAELILFNGMQQEGHYGEYQTELVGIESKQAQVKIIDYQIKNTESPLHIHLGQAISRGERMDYTLQKSVELGVQIITPLFTERCGVDLQGERLEKRMQHWQQVIISACEQSGRCYIPELKAPCSLEKWLMELKVDLAWIMDPRASTPLSAIQKSVGRVALLCGPEGGLSELELDQAKQHGLLGLLMGPRILRTETAALTALSLLQAQWGDF